MEDFVDNFLYEMQIQTVEDVTDLKVLLQTFASFVEDEVLDRLDLALTDVFNKQFLESDNANNG